MGEHGGYVAKVHSVEGVKGKILVSQGKEELAFPRGFSPLGEDWPEALLRPGGQPRGLIKSSGESGCRRCQRQHGQFRADGLTQRSGKTLKSAVEVRQVVRAADNYMFQDQSVWPIKVGDGTDQTGSGCAIGYRGRVLCETQRPCSQ